MCSLYKLMYKGTYVYLSAVHKLFISFTITIFSNNTKHKKNTSISACIFHFLYFPIAFTYNLAMNVGISLGNP